MINITFIKKLLLFSILLFLTGCTATMQYTAVLDKDGNVLKNSPVEGKTSYGRFEDTILELTDKFVYQDVEIYINPTQKCTDLLFGFMKFERLGCPLSLAGGDQYSIFMEIKNISSKPIIFYADNIFLLKEDEILKYNLQCTNQIHQYDKNKQVYLKDGERQATLMPGEYIEIKVIVGDWNKIGDRFQINLSDALSIDEKIIFNMEHLTVHKVGRTVH